MSSRVALITGGARGIGRAIADRLLLDGWRVAVAARTPASAEAWTTAMAERGSTTTLAVVADVSDPAADERLVSAVEHAFGGIDALIHAAGPFHRVPLLQETWPEWQAAFAHNLHPAFRLTQRVAPTMRRRRWGRILTFGMANADRLTGQENVTAYTAAKVALLVLTRSFAKALGPHGITANTISPGFIATGGMAPDDLAAIAPRIPAGRIGEPGDAAAVARFLLSDEAGYVNGANIAVSGGWGV